MISRVIAVLALLPLTATAGEVYNVRPAKKATYLASDSICLDGLGVILNGHGCGQIFIEVVNGYKQVTCTIKNKTDPLLDYTYVVVEHGQKTLDEHSRYDTMCADTNMVLLRSI